MPKPLKISNMKNASIKIDRLELRLKGLKRQKANLILENLRPALITEFAKVHDLVPTHNALRPESVELGTFPVSSQVSPADLACIIAGRIVGIFTPEGS
jgi:hypothetical protein